MPRRFGFVQGLPHNADVSRMGAVLSVLSVIPLSVSAGYVRVRVRRARVARTTQEWVQYLREDVAALLSTTR
jgi:hypothetical protein